MRILPSGWQCVRFRKLFRSNTASGQSLYNLFLKLDFNFFDKSAFYHGKFRFMRRMHNLATPGFALKRHEVISIGGIEMGKPLLQKRLLSTALLAFGIALCANDATSSH